MFDKLQKILVRPLNGFETQKILNWINEKKYTEEEIISAYEYCESKHINYIAKYLETNKQQKPYWYDKKITDEPLKPDELLKYQKEMKEFYDSEEEWKQRTDELLQISKSYYNK